MTTWIVLLTTKHLPSPTRGHLYVHIVMDIIMGCSHRAEHKPQSILPLVERTSVP